MIEFRDICLRYGEQTLFDHFNLTVNQGETVLLNGPSGRGKSTLIRMIPGFIHPDRGEILLDGQKLDRHTLKQFRQRICYVSQDVDLRDEPVRELLTEIFHYRINRHIPSPMARVKDLMEEFLLPGDILDKKVRELSGGERQRVGIILCLVLNRDIWLLDEITSALDGDLKEAVVRKIRESEKTLFVISHDPQWEALPDRRIVTW